MHRGVVSGILFLILIQLSVSFVNGNKVSTLNGEKVCGMYLLEAANANGAKSIGERPNASICASTCYDDDRCLAADFDQMYNTCHLHYKKQPPNTNACCVRFVKYKCSTGCSEKFQPVYHMIPRRKGPPMEGNNVKECKENCLKRLDCRGFHVLKNPFKCYMKIHPITSSVVARDGRLYYLRLSCITPKHLPVEVKPTPRALRYKKYPNEKKVCGMHMFLGASSDTGHNLGRMKDPVACASTCFNDTRCKASEFDVKTQECYSHPNTKDIQARKCCMRFEKFCEYGGCHEEFVRFEERSPPHKGKAYETTNPEECKKHCLRHANCRGFHIDSSLKKCFLQNEIFIKFNRIPTSAYYMRQKCFLDPLNTTVQQEIMQIFKDRVKELRRPIKRVYSSGHNFKRGALDVIFVVDSSGSIADRRRHNGLDNWRLVLDFVRQIVMQIVETPRNDPRFAFISFSNFARLEFDFKKYNRNFLKLEYAVTTVPYIGGTTNMTGGFLVAEDRLIGNAISGNRLSARDVIVLITDGVNTRDRALLRPTVSRIRSHHVEVIGVGVTKQVNAAEIKSLISDQRYYIHVDDFADLPQVVSKVVNLINLL